MTTHRLPRSEGVEAPFRERLGSVGARYLGCKPCLVEYLDTFLTILSVIVDDLCQRR